MITTIRIAGKTLDGKKQVRFALSPIVGIGKNNVKVILDDLKIPYSTLLGELEEDTLSKLRNKLEEYVLEADLVRQTKSNIKHLTDIGTWRGNRHKLHLPTRGQTTRTNSRTVRGNKKGTGPSGRAKAASKT